MSDGNENTPQLGPFPGRLSYHTTRAIEFLKTGKPGDTIDRRGMAELTGRSCDHGTPGDGNVRSAISHVERNFGIVWRWSRPGQHWRCLNDPECVAVTKSTIDCGRRRVRRALNVAKTVNYKSLNPEEQRDHSLNVVAAGMMLTSGSGHFRKRLSTLADDQLQQPDSAKLLSLFQS